MRQSGTGPAANGSAVEDPNAESYGLPVADAAQPAAAPDPAGGGSPVAQGTGLSVTLAVGDSAQGWQDPSYGECRSVHCRHLEITLHNAPAGDYEVACWSSLDNQRPWHADTWHWPSSSLWTKGACWYSFPGEQVWVVINRSAKSNVVTWPTATTGHPKPPTSNTFTAVSAGKSHVCGLRSDGSVVCWGRNSRGQASPPDGVFTAVSTGGNHSCGLRPDGSVVCWGNNDSGQASPPDGVFTAVSTGGDHSCGLSDGSVVCWGNNLYGQASPPDGVFTAVSTGGDHSCGLRPDGSVVCWGNNDSGQASPPDGVFTAVSTGESHSCGLSDGSVVCWGNNLYGQASPPDGVFTAVSAGGAHSCGLRPHGSMVCWGNNLYGQASPPDGVFTAVSAGESHSCGLSDGSMVCWGNNLYGQASPPDGVFTAVSAGELHSCGLSDGSMVCWGNNLYGQASPPDGVFTAVSTGESHSCGLSDGWVVCWGNNSRGQASPPDGVFTAVSTGESHSCGLSDGWVVCWGNNLYGQASPPDGVFTAVSAGGAHSCGLRPHGSVVCWGNNDSGEASPPDGVFVAVSAGESHSCGLRPDGSVVCWGDNDSGEASPPDGVFTAVSSGESYSCGLRPDGSVTCWGALNTELRTAGEEGGGGSGSSGDVAGRPGRVVGVGYGLGEFGRELFWTPWAGVVEYEIDAREAGGDRADYRDDITCLDIADRCGYLFDWDWQTSDVFRAASEFRVRAVNEAGAGPWSEWVAQTTAVGLCDAGSVAQFSDVRMGDYGAEYVLCMRALGLSVGRVDGSYGAGSELTRAQMASFLVRLWRDVLGGQCPVGVETPFVDVAGNTHEGSIACLYGLGITMGTTAVTYGPGEKLKAFQISRLLVRVYENAGNSCDAAGEGLERAAACLAELRVISSEAEGTSIGSVTRDQMAVYVVGLWHNMAGRGLPPPPPERPANDGTPSGGSESATTPDNTFSAVSEAELAEVRAMFDSIPKIREEIDSLITGLDLAIEDMDQLIARAHQTSNEGCQLVQIYYEMDTLRFDIRNSVTGRRLDAFIVALEAEILGWEFDWQPQESETPGDFDYAALDESILGEDFDSQASEVGQELKTTVIRLRQRQKKMYYQTLQLAAIDERHTLLDPKCSPIIY